MKKIYTLKVFIVTLAFVGSGFFSVAQCPTGAAQATVNWDQLDYLSQTGTYSGFVTTPMMQSQNFTMGRNRLTVNFPTATMTTVGENTTNLAEAGSFGNGADVEYNGNGAITINFDTVVFNLQFSLYDIDLMQSVRITAVDAQATPVPLNITMTPLAGGIITVAGNGGTTPTATTSNTTAANTDLRGTLNVSISGSSPAAARGVKYVTITMGFGGGAAGNFWLSDLTACVYGAFPIRYYASQEPWRYQPAYFMVTPDNNGIYLMNPLTGVADWIFSETGSPWVNSMAYDHVNKVLYYVMDNPSPIATNRSLKKYDFNTETPSIVIADLRTFGIPLFDIVVESAGAAFYNGSLFLGIEGSNSGRTSNRESIIWRIDFTASNLPYRASQVFARPADNGSGTLTHDWGDFTIKDGELIDFNTGNQGSTAQFVHFDMQTGNTTFYNTNGNPAPIQAGHIWNDSIFWTGGQGSELGRVALYNENGTIGPKVNATVTACSPAWVGRAGDASDPIRPKSDFGDAPASYDPVWNDKATHEYDCRLRLGPTYDREWDKTVSALATADGTDEDGITTVTILTPGTWNYVQQIRVFNNTGANATLIGWLDYNGNGTFDPVEGRSVTVASNAALQTITVTWPSLTSSLIPGSNTFVRYRLTSASNGMTVNNATRWYPNGEVEDYRVAVGEVLPVQLINFSARLETGNKVMFDWTVTHETDFEGYDIERSTNEEDWVKIADIPPAEGYDLLRHYTAYDNAPLYGTSYYRLKLKSLGGYYTYSPVRMIKTGSSKNEITVVPNPARDRAYVEYQVSNNESAELIIIDASGRIVKRKQVTLIPGLNRIQLEDLNKLGAGMYNVQLHMIAKKLSVKLIIQ